jgi:hypothetical protein
MPSWLFAPPTSYHDEMNLFRALIPSWRFFDGFESVTALQFRVISDEGQESGAWKAALPLNEARSFGAIFFNPKGNLRLACLSLVERLMEEDELTTESVSYRLVENLVRYQLRNSGAECSSEARFQFRITSGGEEVLVSMEHSVR